MLIKNLTALCCPSCQSTFELTNELIADSYIDSALLYCRYCNIAVPIVNGFVLFGESRPWTVQLSAADWLFDLKHTKFSTTNGYAEFLQEKQRRGSSDAYAAFQPFNESSRALYPFISMLRRTLNAGDIILDVWCRTGWSGELLAGLFPQQQVISLWEGDSNVLGYRGFDYWLKAAKRHPNLEVIFTHADQSLPFASDSVRVVHGLDSLHRYDKDIFLTECLRICESDGLLIFPHIHLSNSEPYPFFERGCQQYHGRDWKTRVDALLLASKRSCWILPEVELFEADSLFKLNDDNETSHYNGLLLIAATKFDGCQLEASKYLPLTADCRLIQSPLFNVDLNQGWVSANTERLGGFAPEILSRHPCYDQHLNQIRQPRLTANQARLLWQAQNGLTLGAIASVMKLSQDVILQLADSLSKRELIHAAPVSKAMWDLQSFYGFVRLPQTVTNDFSEVWQDLSARYQSLPIIHWLQDGSQLLFEDVDFLVNATRAALRVRNINASTRIAMASSHHPAALLLCWACWLEGVCVVLLDENQPLEVLRSLQRRCNALWLFTDNPSLLGEQNEHSVLFDSAEVDSSLLPKKYQLFSTLLETYDDEDIPSSKVTPNADAVILFSSGSSGEAKCIVLTQKALCISGFNMVSTFNWQRERLLSLGPFSMMSGVRNAMVASLVSGSTILLPGQETLMPINAWQQAQDQKVTVITTVPSWLEILSRAGNRLAASESLRQILVTGSVLKARVRKEFTAQTGVEVEGYYGLTETGGLCLATNTVNADATLVAEKENCIGYPTGALIHIVDKVGELVDIDQIGLLRVYSDQLMKRYLDDPITTERAFDNGWLLTGDLAYWDDGGRVYLQGRDDDLIKLRDGSRLHPSTLEQLLNALPGVEDAAVIITEPFHSLLGLVVTEEPLEQLLNTLRQQQPDQHLPDKLKRVTSLPYNRNGKLLRNILHTLASGD